MILDSKESPLTEELKSYMKNIYPRSLAYGISIAFWTWVISTVYLNSKL